MNLNRKINIQALILSLVLYLSVAASAENYTDDKFKNLESTSIEYSCSSFAVYADKAIYGMNFDYPQHVIEKLTIEEIDEMKIFHCGFMYNDNFISVSDMNSDGFFSSSQILVPRFESIEYNDRSDNEMFFWELHGQALSSFRTIDDMNRILSNKRIIQSRQTSIHMIAADRYGNALIIDPAKEINAITKIKNDCIVMTNFPVYTVENNHYQKAEGVGADRFIIAHDYIIEHKAGFRMEDGMKVLEKVVLLEDQCITRCSMVFDPSENEILVVIEREFDKIWKVKLNNKTIETYKGFDTYQKLDIDSEGISIETLWRNS